MIYGLFTGTGLKTLHSGSLNPFLRNAGNAATKAFAEEVAKPEMINFSEHTFIPIIVAQGRIKEGYPEQR